MNGPMPTWASRSQTETQFRFFVSRKNLILPILAGFVLVAALTAYVHQWVQVREGWDAELTMLSRQLRLGSTKDQLEGRIQNYCNRVSARWTITDEKKLWVIANHGRFGAQERVLNLEFDERGVLRHRSVRTADDPRRPPEDAPPDF